MLVSCSNVLVDSIFATPALDATNVLFVATSLYFYCREITTQVCFVSYETKTYAAAPQTCRPPRMTCIFESPCAREGVLQRYSDSLAYSAWTWIFPNLQLKSLELKKPDPWRWSIVPPLHFWGTTKTLQKRRSHGQRYLTSKFLFLVQKSLHVCGPEVCRLKPPADTKTIRASGHHFQVCLVFTNMFSLLLIDTDYLWSHIQRSPQCSWYRDVNRTILQARNFLLARQENVQKKFENYLQQQRNFTSNYCRWDETNRLRKIPK